MAIGDVHEVTTGECTDLYCIDTGMYDTAEYGAVYVLDDDRPALVDTGIGTNYERILDALDEVGLAPADVEVLALTHVHLDHAGGAGFLADACPNAEVFVHGIGAPHLVDPSGLVRGTRRAVREQWEFYAEPEPVPADRIREIADGDVVDLGTHELRVHHAPGHAPHQVVFEDPANDAVFVADAAGIWVPQVERITVTSPPPNFDLEQCLDDVALLGDLAPETLLFAHYGPRPRGDVLDEYATELTEWVAAIEQKRAELGDDEAVAEYFARESPFDSIWGERKARTETAMNVRGVLRYLDTRE